MYYTHVFNAWVFIIGTHTNRYMHKNGFRQCGSHD